MKHIKDTKPLKGFLSTGEKADSFSPALQNLAAEWQTDEHKEQARQEIARNEVLAKIQEATKIIKDAKQEDPGSLHRMEWDSVYDLSANVMDEYTKSVDGILSELNQLYRKQYLWQEAAFVKDSHRGATLIGRAEEWMRLKENHLEFKQAELASSANVIKTTIERLTKK
ncbi:GMC2 (YLR445W) [Zygosaccharomyces parabailii]|nr:GMC2 (YLR445W) [Zygosaccharomyces parabailii]CDH11403.1 uncharacterized protein ZBAI_03189 [Zygosaccharomyces bailii ISA1307]